MSGPLAPIPGQDTALRPGTGLFLTTQPSRTRKIGYRSQHNSQEGTDGAMCARYSLTSPPEAVRAWFRYSGNHDFPPRYNIAPTQPVAIVRNDIRGSRAFVLVRWGLIPSWAKEPEKFSTLINARAETAAKKPSFRAALRHRRCIVPADDFYEWTGTKGDKQPHLICRKDGQMLAFAGLSEDWLGADGSEVETMAILTVAASAEMSRIHDRMPLILEPEHFDTWLDCTSGSSRNVMPLIDVPKAPPLEIIAVSRQLNNPHNDFADVQQPLELPLG